MTLYKSSVGGTDLLWTESIWAKNGEMCIICWNGWISRRWRTWLSGWCTLLHSAPHKMLTMNCSPYQFTDNQKRHQMPVTYGCKLPHSFQYQVHCINHISGFPHFFFEAQRPHEKLSCFSSIFTLHLLSFDKKKFNVVNRLEKNQ